MLKVVLGKYNEITQNNKEKERISRSITEVTHTGIPSGTSDENNKGISR